MQPSPHRRNRRFAAVALTALVFAAGCVKQDPPGLEVVALEANITFGIDTPAPAPVGFVPPPVAQLTEEELEELPEAPRLPTPAPRAPISFACPTAPLGEFAAPAPADVADQPKEGTYVWRPGPPTVLEALQFDVNQADLFDRVVFNVSDVTETTSPYEPTESAPAVGGPVPPIRTFTYQMATYYRSGMVVLDSYKVVSGGVTESVGAINFGPQFYTGQPDRGVSLLSRQVIVNNRIVSAFEPSTPVLLLPLPAIGGATFQTVSYDPVFGTTYMLYGEVKDRARVDACGKEVDGWRVVAQAAFRDPRDGPAAPPRTATLTYFVATGMGGLIAHEAGTKLDLPRFPVSGTPLDGATPPNPDLPDTGTGPEPFEFSLATRDPGPIVRPEPKPQGLIAND